jgi:DNA-binding transcriptional MerR regulator
MEYTINKLAQLAGVSTRTLRYYDQIGLLPPVRIGENGYRYYDQDNLLQLQQILFYRQLSVPLKDIQSILTAPEFETQQALEDHRSALQHKASQLEMLIGTIDNTITDLQGENEMEKENYFKGFKEEDYAEETKSRWGSDPTYQESQRNWDSYNPEKREAIKAKGGQLAARIINLAADPSVDDPEVMEAVGEYHQYFNIYFYDTTIERLRGLAGMWASDERFGETYNLFHPQGAELISKAVMAYCDQN